MAGTPGWRTDLYTSPGTLMSHANSIVLFQQQGIMMAPELKSHEVDMPFTGHTSEGFTQQAYAQKMIDEYKAGPIERSAIFFIFSLKMRTISTRMAA